MDAVKGARVKELIEKALNGDEAAPHLDDCNYETYKGYVIIPDEENTLNSREEVDELLGLLFPHLWKKSE